MSRKNKPQKHEVNKSSSIPSLVSPIVEKEWKRSTNGVLFALIGLLIIGILLINQPLSYWPSYKYPPYGEVPKNYVQRPYLVSSIESAGRLQRKMLPWENPGYYFGGVLIFIGIRFFLPEKKREEEVEDQG